MSGSYMFKVSSIVFNQTLLTANFFKQTLNNISIQQAHSSNDTQPKCDFISGKPWETHSEEQNW